jgi:hypothetical protein
MKMSIVVIAVLAVSLFALAAIIFSYRLQEGMTDPTISDTQYYGLVSVLRRISTADPKFESPFGLYVISNMGITDPAYTTILIDSDTLIKEKLTALMELVNSTPPKKLPPYTVRPKKIYEKVHFETTPQKDPTSKK